MNHLRKALHTVGDTLSPKTSSSNATSAGSLSGCILIQGGTVTVAQRKVKVGDKVWGGGLGVPRICLAVLGSQLSYSIGWRCKHGPLLVPPPSPSLVWQNSPARGQSN